MSIFLFTAEAQRKAGSIKKAEMEEGRFALVIWQMREF
jgi:hypothetical protein